MTTCVVDHKDHLGKGRFDRREIFFTMKVMKHYKMLPRVVVHAPSLETLTVRFVGALNKLI